METIDWIFWLTILNTLLLLGWTQMINKWIVVKEPNDIYLLKCSSCGFSFTSYKNEDPADRGLYHCPWCGTRLIDPDEDER